MLDAQGQLRNRPCCVPLAPVTWAAGLSSPPPPPGHAVVSAMQRLTTETAVATARYRSLGLCPAPCARFHTRSPGSPPLPGGGPPSPHPPEAQCPAPGQAAGPHAGRGPTQGSPALQPGPRGLSPTEEQEGVCGDEQRGPCPQTCPALTPRGRRVLVSSRAESLGQVWAPRNLRSLFSRKPVTFSCTGPLRASGRLQRRAGASRTGCCRWPRLSVLSVCPRCPSLSHTGSTDQHSSAPTRADTHAPTMI